MVVEIKKEGSNGLVYLAILIGLIAVSASFYIIFKQVANPTQTVGNNSTSTTKTNSPEIKTGNENLSQEIIKSADGAWSTYINRVYNFEIGYSSAIQVYGQFFDDPEKYLNTAPPTPVEINKGSSVQPYLLVKVTDTHGKEVSVPPFGSGVYKKNEDVVVDGVQTKLYSVMSNKKGEVLVRYNQYVVFKKGDLQFELYMTGIPINDGARFESSYKKTLLTFKRY